MAKTKKTSSISKGTVAAVSVGAATAAVAAVGAYWFYGAKDAAQHRKAARSWMLKARGEVLAAVEAAVEKAGEIDKETYAKIVASVLKQYSKHAGVTPAEMAHVTRDMNEAWRHMQMARKSSATKKVTKAVKKTVKKLL